MAANEEKSIRIKKFNGEDFNFMKMQIEDYLYKKGMHLPLLGEKIIDMKDEEQALLDRQALGIIQLTLSCNVTFNIAKKNTTTGFLVALSNMYEKPSASNKVHLMKRLFNLRMIQGVSMAAHINEFSIIITQLSLVEIEFDEEV